MPPTVSLVITVYNREDYLSAAIESILTQTYADFELLIWDDGSYDDSVAIAQHYALQDHAFVSLLHPIKVGHRL